LLLTALGQHETPTIGRIVWNALLLPTREEPLLGVAWTLQYELVFYIIFLIAIVNRVAGASLTAAWLGWIGAGVAGLAPSGGPSALYGAYNIEFCLGMLTACILLRWHVPSPKILGTIGAVLFAAAAVAESSGFLDGNGNFARLASRLAYGVPASLLLLGVAAAERAGRCHPPLWLRSLGSASYSIYLFQFLFIGIMWKIWQIAGMDREVSMVLTFVALSCAALAGGVVVSMLLEKPLLLLTRKKHLKLISTVQIPQHGGS